MSFTFKRKESVPESVRRLALNCVKKALKSCEDEPKAIHSTRKEIKKFRALLRLTRHEIARKDFKDVLDGLRAAADYLAPARDAHVKTQAFHDLLKHRNEPSSSSHFQKVPDALKKECRAAALNIRENHAVKEVRKILRKQPKKVEKFDFKKGGWAAIGPGLKKSYRDARDARDLAVTEPFPENFHDWRKRVKDLWYDVQLLEPIWPEQMCALASELEKLSEFLGDDHDLHMLRETVIKKSSDPERPELLRLIDARQDELRAKATTLGRSLLQEKPSAFCDRLHGYWKSWKSDKDRSDGFSDTPILEQSEPAPA